MLSPHLCPNIFAHLSCAGVPVVINVDDTDGRLKHINQSPKMIFMVMADHNHFQTANAMVVEEGKKRRPCSPFSERVFGVVELE